MGKVGGALVRVRLCAGASVCACKCVYVCFVCVYVCASHDLHDGMGSAAKLRCNDTIGSPCSWFILIQGTDTHVHTQNHVRGNNQINRRTCKGNGIAFVATH